MKAQDYVGSSDNAQTLLEQERIAKDKYNAAAAASQHVIEYFSVDAPYNQGTYVASTNSYNLQIPLRRLATYNDWTIAYQYDQLVAFDSTGQTVRSKECKLVLDGTAFVYNNGKLFSGKLTHTPSEKEVRDEEILAQGLAIAEHNERIYKKIRQLNERLK